MVCDVLSAGINQIPRRMLCRLHKTIVFDNYSVYGAVINTLDTTYNVVPTNCVDFFFLYFSIHR